MSELDIGILALQGDVAENFMSTMAAMNELGIDGSVSQVKTPDQISAVDGLIVPGGESTMMGQLSMVNGAMSVLKEKIESGMPVLGICAGMILLAKNSKDRVVGSTKQPLLDVLDVELSAIHLADKKIPLRLKFPWMPWTYHHFRECLFALQLSCVLALAWKPWENLTRRLLL